MPTSVALGNHFEEFVRKQLESGRFNNVSEIVRAGLRLLEDEEKLRQIRHRELKAAMMIGVSASNASCTVARCWDTTTESIDDAACVSR
jgi:antitoxin ParD1/3/4